MRTARGFSLVEMTMAIGVIVLLAGLTLSAGTAVVRNAERRTTETAIAQLDTATREWELLADRKLTWWDATDDPSAYDHADVHGDTPEVLIITELLDVVTRSHAGREIVARIDPDLVYRYEDDTAPWLVHPATRSKVIESFIGSITVLDAWGTPVYATHPGRPWAEGDGTLDEDGTIRTYNESLYGIAPNRRIVFVSAGPDGLFGLHHEFPPGSYTAMHDARLDNIYSSSISFAAYEP